LLDIVVVLAGPAARMKLRPSRPSKRKEWGDDLKLAQAFANANPTKRSSNEVDQNLFHVDIP
jgi:hypothetical protein